MAKNFHLWEVDPFFTAADEVQDSADRLESVYRNWIHAKITNGMCVPDYQRNLSTALGTCKWQLEEFERAVSLAASGSSDRNNEASARHRQFIDAIQSQITCIERSLLNLEECRGLKRLPIVNLCHEDTDDLALFLCGSRDYVDNHFMDSYSSERNAQSTSFGPTGYEDRVSTCFAANMNNIPNKHGYTNAHGDRGFDVDQVSKSEDALLDIIVDHGNCTMSDPPPEHSFTDDSDGVQNSAVRMNGWLRSASLGSSLNLWKSGSVTRNVKKQQDGGTGNVKSIWSCLKRKDWIGEPGYLKNGLKRWKDGDRDDHELSALLGQASEFQKDIGMEDGHMTCSTVHRHIASGGPLAIHCVCAAFPLAQPVQIASAILVALGFVGMLSFRVTVGSF